MDPLSTSIDGGGGGFPVPNFSRGLVVLGWVGPPGCPPFETGLILDIRDGGAGIWGVVYLRPIFRLIRMFFFEFSVPSAIRDQDGSTSLPHLDRCIVPLQFFPPLKGPKPKGQSVGEIPSLSVNRSVNHVVRRYVSWIVNQPVNQPGSHIHSHNEECLSPSLLKSGPTPPPHPQTCPTRSSSCSPSSPKASSSSTSAWPCSPSSWCVPARGSSRTPIHGELSNLK